MRKIFIMHPGNANYPEVTAYKNYFQNRGADVLIGSTSEFRKLEKKNDIILWSIMGFYPDRLASDFVIHDYRSLSVGGWPAMKDFAKRHFNCQPNLRIFQNKRQQQIMGFGAGVPSVILPMGVPNWIFEVQEESGQDEKKADFCYIGEMSVERGFDRVLEAFIKKYSDGNKSLLLVGKPDPHIHEKFSKTENLIFTGPLPQRDALKHVAQSDVAVCYFPYHRPHCYQTPTKLLEYAALGKKILCNDSPSNIQCCEEMGINSVITTANIFDGIDEEAMRGAKTNRRSDFANLVWDKVIEQSNVVSFLPDDLKRRLS
ncbi:glycosyltransferase (plasmid) [Paraburkholderia sprentiae WSM5005]|uniref:Glycosyltransferase n=1 Tax=Paraburkholderia sprentiae WSM5005 TaxID=754502 RepID=A0A1I9YS79_9BURK|nr:glycosyltransferase [Paraburkholderia sprentiae]APA89777.1 glycosyltransferase [Paraburkholderia sprentiae WSM5005]